MYRICDWDYGGREGVREVVKENFNDIIKWYSYEGIILLYYFIFFCYLFGCMVVDDINIFSVCYVFCCYVILLIL